MTTFVKAASGVAVGSVAILMASTSISHSHALFPSWRSEQGLVPLPWDCPAGPDARCDPPAGVDPGDVLWKRGGGSKDGGSGDLPSNAPPMPMPTVPPEAVVPPSIDPPVVPPGKPCNGIGGKCDQPLTPPVPPQACGGVATPPEMREFCTTAWKQGALDAGDTGDCAGWFEMFTTGILPSSVGDCPSPPPGKSTRDARLWPFASDSPWNRPIGSGAQFGGNPGIGSGAGINSGDWTVAVSIYSPDAPAVHMSQSTTCGNGAQAGVPIPELHIAASLDGSGPMNCYRDGFLVAVHNDNIAYGFTRFKRTGAGSAIYSYHNHKPEADNIVTGSGWWGSGWSGGGHWIAGSSLLAGLIRQWEVAGIASGQMPHMTHVLQATLPYSMLKSAGPRLPATMVDGTSERYSGSVAMGALVAIPPSFNVEAAGWSAPAKALALTLQKYGAYIVGQGGGGLRLYAEDGTNVGAMSQNLGEIAQQLRVVENNSPSSLGGGGTYPEHLWPVPTPVGF